MKSTTAERVLVSKGCGRTPEYSDMGGETSPRHRARPFVPSSMLRKRMCSHRCDGEQSTLLPFLSQPLTGVRDRREKDWRKEEELETECSAKCNVSS